MATELETAREQLAEVRAAISSVLLRGQSLTMPNQRGMQRASLSDLREMEKDLQARIGRLQARGGLISQRIIPL